MEAVYEEAKEYGISYTLNSIINNFFDGIESTIEDDLINGTAESRGQVMGGIAGMILEAVIASAAAMKMKGMADEVEGWGSGGGLQFDTMGEKLPQSVLANERLIGE